MSSISRCDIFITSPSPRGRCFVSSCFGADDGFVLSVHFIVLTDKQSESPDSGTEIFTTLKIQTTPTKTTFLLMSTFRPNSLLSGVWELKWRNTSTEKGMVRSFKRCTVYTVFKVVSYSQLHSDLGMTYFSAS